MLNRRRGSVKLHHDAGKRQVPNPASTPSNSQTSKSVPTQADPPQASTSVATPTLPTTSHSSFVFITNSLPLIVHQSSDSSVTVVVELPSTTRASSSSLPPLIPSTSSIPLVAFSTSSIVPSTTEPSPSASSSATDVALVTPMSGAVPLTTTTFIGALASLSPAPAKPSSSSFFQNRAESGAVLGLVSLVALAGFGFIAYRLYRAMKERRADRETEDAARDAANVKVRLDDDDDVYGSPSKGRGMFQIFNRPPMIPLDFSTNRGYGGGMFNGKRRSTESINPFLHNGADAYNGPLPLHHQPVQRGGAPPYAPPTLDSAGYITQTRGLLRTSSESTASMISNRSSESNVPSGTVSHATSPQPPASQQSPLPALPLPESFGEGEPGRRNPALTKSVGDNEDYSGSIRRVLKIANE